jgi:hypothetical protein
MAFGLKAVEIVSHGEGIVEETGLDAKRRGKVLDGEEEGVLSLHPHREAEGSTDD